MSAALSRTIAIASNTFREAVRNRAFIGLMILAISFLFFSLVLSELAVRGEKVRVILDFGYFSIGLFGVIIAVVMGVILVYKEIEKKTIFTIIPKPIHRFEIIIGKYLGMTALLILEVGLMALVWVLALWLKDAPISWDILRALVLIFSEILLIASIAILFSSFSSPILSGIFTIGIFVIGRVVHMVDQMLNARRGLFVDVPALRPFGEALVAVVPDLQVFNVTQDLLLNLPVSNSYVIASFGYAAAYIVCFVAVAVILFQRRDFI